MFEMILDAVITSVLYTGFWILMMKLVEKIKESYADDWSDEDEQHG